MKSAVRMENSFKRAPVLQVMVAVCGQKKGLTSRSLLITVCWRAVTRVNYRLQVVIQFLEGPYQFLVNKTTRIILVPT